MEGADLAAQRKIEFDVALAWHVMAISRENEGKRSLIPLSKYLDRIRPAVSQAQSADEVAAVFLALKGRGKSVNIRERERA
jgi:hypothetical protein